MISRHKSPVFFLFFDWTFSFFIVRNKGFSRQHFYRVVFSIDFLYKKRLFFTFVISQYRHGAFVVLRANVERQKEMDRSSFFFQSTAALVDAAIRHAIAYWNEYAIVHLYSTHIYSTLYLIVDNFIYSFLFSRSIIEFYF